MSGKQRKPWLAGILSVVTPGLGYLYIGELRRAATFYGLVTSFTLLFPVTFDLPFAQLPYIVVLLLFGIGMWSLYIYQIVHSVRLTRAHRQSYELKPYNRWYVYVLIILLAATLTGAVSALTETPLRQFYKFPSGSMRPTLLIGDHVTVDKSAYWSRDPERGDLVVFLYPEDETKDFMKRIIGMPSETIEINDKVVSINGSPWDDSGYTQRIDPGTIDGSINPRDNFGPVTVPANGYFVLGDNRDQSLDSRFWGFVQREKISGKVDRIYWSWKGKGGWTEWVRWERIGKRIS